MKFSLQQLNKINTFPENIKVTYDLSHYLKGSSMDLDTDILAIKATDVEISITKVNTDTYSFDYHVVTDLIVPCSLTLEPVDYHMDISFNEIYSTMELDDENYFPFENNSVDCEMVVWSNIVTNIPIRVVREDAYEILKARNIVLDEIPND